MMKKNPIGVGLIGVGRHGVRYARHILQDLPTASLRAVCRQHPERGLDLPGAESVKVYGEAQSLIADPSVDVVIVVSHRCARHGCRSPSSRGSVNDGTDPAVRFNYSGDEKTATAHRTFRTTSFNQSYRDEGEQFRSFRWL
ncbi:MAG: Gfo/Idh/MocA family oxidoreductase [Nitrospirae bacterium]|nr:Gfo/Idh/MocA family oxidoreductase [Nitrospirota bacterium]